MYKGLIESPNILVTAPDMKEEIILFKIRQINNFYLIKNLLELLLSLINYIN